MTHIFLRVTSYWRFYKPSRISHNSNNTRNSPIINMGRLSFVCGIVKVHWMIWCILFYLSLNTACCIFTFLNLKSKEPIYTNTLIYLICFTVRLYTCIHALSVSVNRYISFLMKYIFPLQLDYISIYMRYLCQWTDIYLVLSCTLSP